VAIVKIDFVTTNEAGATGAAKRVQQELLNLRAGATATAGTLSEQLGQAFQRLERHEPTLVMRQLRGTIDDIAASAIGAHGPVGRLAVSLAGLAPGGALTLGVIGGLAAIGLEIKAIVGFTDALERSLFKANQQFAQMTGGGAALAFRAMAASQAAENPDRPNIFVRGIAAIGSRAGLGEGDLAEAIAVGQASKIATATQEAARFWELFHRGQEEARRREEQRQQDQQRAVIDQLATNARLRLGPEASPFDVSRLNEDLALIRLGFSNLDEPTKTRIADLVREQGALERLNITRSLIPDIFVDFAALAQQLATIQFPAIQLTFKNTAFVEEVSKGAALAQLDLAKAMQLSTKSAQEAARAHQLAAAQIISAVSGLIAGIVSGGSPGGLISGFGGLIGIFNPVAGAIVGGLGTILLANESNEERRHGELLRALEPVGELLFIVAQSTTDPDSLDSLVRRMEQATGRRISVRFGGR
jgi:hypothetical protein